MTRGAAELLVPVLAALGQRTRLHLLSHVAQTGGKGLTAGEIARAIECPASTLSFHLKELSRAGVLEARSRGRFVIYALRGDVLQELARFIGELGNAGGSRAGRPRGGVERRKIRRPREIDRLQLSIFGD